MTESREPLRAGISAFGREIEVCVSDGTDAFGQFLVSVYVDEKVRWMALFTDKGDEK